MVVIGVAGIFLPLIPTTGPLLAASFLFAKGSPRLQQLLCANKITGSYINYLNGSRVMPTHARVCTVAWLWCSLGTGMYALSWMDLLKMSVAVFYVVGGTIATIFILNFRRQSSVSNALQKTKRFEGSRGPIPTLREKLDEAVVHELLAISQEIDDACTTRYPSVQELTFVNAVLQRTTSGKECDLRESSRFNDHLTR